MYALALAIALAQLIASWAWASGAHVTVEQVALHEEAVAHGHADHHGGGHAHGHGDHHHAGQDHALQETPGPVFAPGDDHAGLYQNVLNGALVERPVFLSRVNWHRLGPHDELSPAQNFPPVPHWPPITP